METATVVSSPATWLPEEDIMLKKAIEDGASIEALAKGAVPFSRTFTLQEVHDRWHNLIYYPDVSVQDSAHLFPGEPDKHNEINANHRKRKVGSIRKRYYAILKRIRHDFSGSADLGVFTESNLHKFTSNGGTGKRLLLGEELSNTNVYNMGFSPPLPGMPIWETMEDIDNDSTSKSLDKKNDDSFINSVSILDGDFVDLPDSLFDFSKNGTLLTDYSGSVPVEKTCCDNTVLNVPLDMDCFDTLDVGEEPRVNANAIEPEVAHVNVQVSSALTLNNNPLEHTEGELYCSLNAEDPEIPCNDNIFLLIHEDASCATSTMTSITISDIDPVSIKERSIVIGVNSEEERGELVESSKTLQVYSSYLLPKMGQVHTGEMFTVITESDDTCKILIPRYNADPDPSQFEPAPEANLDKDVKKSVDIPVISGELPLNAEIGLVEITPPEPVFKPSTPDQERPEKENDDPKFSDIEAVILNMDLGQYDDDLRFTRRVSKYQQGNSKRTIMRFEQCARVSIQRAMTSQGTFAVLYGRRTTHFIRKTEVLLGRSTADTVVDIDLGKEGRNKISRRQAIVKMEDDGSFALKNLAKNPIFVNGVEVGTRESIGLSVSCLIEMRGISFVFEPNQKYIECYMANVRRKSQGQMANFEWLSKDESGIN